MQNPYDAPGIIDTAAPKPSRVAWAAFTAIASTMCYSAAAASVVALRGMGWSDWDANLLVLAPVIFAVPAFILSCLIFRGRAAPRAVLGSVAVLITLSYGIADELGDAYFGIREFLFAPSFFGTLFLTGWALFDAINPWLKEAQDQNNA